MALGLQSLGLSPLGLEFYSQAGGGGSASANPSGVTATAGVSNPTAVGAANASPSGVAATGSVTNPAAVGAANASPAGVTATAGVTNPTATAGSIANPSGATATAGVTNPTAVGAANTSPAGVTATAGITNPTAMGVATASPAGVTAAGSVTNPVAVGAANTSPSGVTATGGVTNPTATAASAANPSGVAATGSVTNPAAVGAANASPAGVTATGGIGQVIANGNIAIGPISITQQMLMTTIRAFVMQIAGGQRVVQTPVNRAAMPVGEFVALSPGAIRPLSQNVSMTADGIRTITRASQFDCQIDCYGANSADLAERISILFRDEYGVGQFALSGYEIVPLYADDAESMPIVSGEEQYERRWSFNIAVQFNPTLTLAQQSANMLQVGLINVDAVYPPQ